MPQGTLDAILRMDTTAKVKSAGNPAPHRQSANAACRIAPSYRIIPMYTEKASTNAAFDTPKRFEEVSLVSFVVY